MPIGTIVPLIEGGQLRALAVNSAKRSAVLPDVPTVSEDAIPGFEAAGWQGYFVPAGTPREIVERIQREDREGHRAARHPGAPQDDGQRSSRPRRPTSSERKFRADVAKFQQVVREAGIPLQ